MKFNCDIEMSGVKSREQFENELTRMLSLYADTEFWSADVVVHINRQVPCDDDEKDALLEEIYRLVLEHPDEITEHEEPYICKGLPSDLVLKDVALDDGEDIDEIRGDLAEAKEGYGLCVCVGHYYDNGDYISGEDEYELDELCVDDLKTIRDFLLESVK